MRQAREAGRSIPTVPWSQLGPDFLRNWDQGQHWAVFGPNGSGKSRLIFTAVEDRVRARGSSAVIFANKRRDATLSKLLALGWHRITAWPPSYNDRVHRRIVFWPAYPGVSNPTGNRDRFVAALDGIMEEGNWVTVFDEARYWLEQMHLRAILDEMWTGSRSNGITVVAGAQGPSWINTAMREELQWGAFFKPQHRERAKEVSDITGDRDLWPVLMDLRPHEFLLGKVREDLFYRSKLPA